MAIERCELTPLSRSDGRNAVQFCSYITATRIADPLGALAGVPEVFDYTRKKGVLATGVVGWNGDIASLAQAAELAEGTRTNAVVLRTIEAALPHELTQEQNAQICREFTAWIVERFGVGAAWAMHSPSKRGDQRNTHVHINFTTRRVCPDRRSLGPKTTELDDLKKRGPEEVTAIRRAWVEHVNRALELANRPERIGVAEPLPDELKTVHLGPEATALERAGIHTKKGDHNRRALALRDEVQQHRDRLDQLRAELQEYDRAILATMQELRELLHEEKARQKRRLEAKQSPGKGRGRHLSTPAGGSLPTNDPRGVPGATGRHSRPRRS